jgi:HSP20 family protein
MLLERVDPLLAEFDRLTQRTFGSADSVGLPMDVIRHEDALIVRADLPGVAKDQISIDLDNRALTITAERHASYGETDTVLLQERFDGAMRRQLRIPDWVDVENVSAKHADGVLTVRLPIAERAKPRRVSVLGAEDAPSNRLAAD